MTDPRAVVVLALVLGAPWALVLVVAFVRGYNVHVTFVRRHREDDNG